MNSSVHIIDKVFLEVNTTNEKTAYYIKNNISSFLNSEVFPKLEKLLEKYDFDGQIFRIDSLDVNFALQDWNRPEVVKYELLKSIEKKIDQALVNTKSDGTFDNGQIENGKELDNSFDKPFDNPLKQFISDPENYHATILFFLKNAYLPWYGKEKYLTELTSNKRWQKSLKQTKLFTELTNLFRTNNIALQRFILQFSEEQILAFIELFEIIQVENKVEIDRFVNNLPHKTRKLFLKLLLKVTLNTSINRAEFVEFVKLQFTENKILELTTERIVDWNNSLLSVTNHFFAKEVNSAFFRLTEEEIQQILTDIGFHNNDTYLGGELEKYVKTNLENKPTILLQEFVNSEKEKESPFFEKDKNEIVAQNAGLVLFHPFLKTFFTQFGWINADGNIKSEHKFEAVQALHYCATGNKSFFEANLIIEKFLCGVPLNTPIPYNSLLNEQVKLEADAMTTELINHWVALKNTSAAGLREMFINRNGKLIQKQNDFRLIVERKVQDILLDKLQWSISIVKLPWRKDLLFVEW